jgi:trk system potassium uptake protein TrkH
MRTMVRIGAVLNVLGAVVALFGATLLVPLALSWILEDGAAASHALALAISVLAGTAIWGATLRRRDDLTPRDAFLLVFLIWVTVPLVGMLPLYRQLPEMSFTDAYFEAASGLTATGATVMVGLDLLPASLNFWRAQMHWLGGLGIIVLAVAVLPMLGVGGRQIFRAEIPGPVKEKRITPRLAETAKGFWMLYAGFTATCALAYKMAGMDWFDSVVHAMSTVSLGGFSSHDASLGYFDSLGIELIAILFMLLGAMSFVTHLVAWRARSFKPYGRDAEIKALLLVVAVSVFGIALFLWRDGVYPDFGTALRYAAINVTSVATTGGFSTVDYGEWPIFAPLWMLFLCAFTCCSASTGGGIKMMRALVMVRQMMRETKLLLHPSARVPIKLGGEVIPNQVVFAVLAYMTIYGASLVVLVFLMTLSGLDLITALTAAVATLNNVGPGLGQVGPSTTFAALSDFQTWLCTAAMLLGRLELLTLLVVLTPGFWTQ